MNEQEPNMEQKCPQCGAPLPAGVPAGLCPACLFKQGATADTAASPESPGFQPPDVEELALLFPQLEIFSLLGKGGMGAVYKARQPGLDRIVALKILPAQAATGPGFVERFNREARALAKLNHPNIVAVYEFGQANNLPFFIMEFVDGLNLRQLEQAGKLSAREALQIVPQICDALQFAHDEGIVHRDIKPENIMVDKKGRVKIADFGIAKILSSEPAVNITETGGAVGTPHYMAPEQMEKPTTVDHRADIFSLGVVFYEMLTGELPLGKFAPPSSRKVEVDVRLDEVVLRALEKDPELRYQKASQVRTAVDTIVGTAPPPPASPAINAEALAQEILARDYDIEIRKCIRRGWALLKSDFWPMVGVTALLIALLGFASSIGGQSLDRVGDHTVEITSGLATLVWGPLMGGLYLYFLKKIRREKTTVETAFSGFSHRFLNLFLAGFVTTVLTAIGFFLILPGIYLLIAWLFALPLVVDKNLDFWSATELSRKVITRHWWKFLGLAIVLLLLLFAGVVACVVGVFIASPLALASLMYAYEDVFGGLPAAPATNPAAAPAGMGPFGTVVSSAAGGPPPIKPGTPPTTAPVPPPPPGSVWTRTTKIGLAAVALVILIVVIAAIQHHAAVCRPQAAQAQANRESFAAAVALAPPAAPTEPVESAPLAAFGPVIEKELQTRSTATNLFLNLGAAQLLTPSAELRDILTGSQPGEDVSRFWEGLDIPKDSRRFQYVDWLRENGGDLMYSGDGKFAGFDGIFAIAHGDSSTNWDDWNDLTAEQATAAVAMVDWEQRAIAANKLGQPSPPAPKVAGNFQPATQLDSREAGGPRVNLLTHDQSVNWYFKTRSGAVGILQLVSFNDTTAKIRYKLVQPSTANPDDPFSSRQTKNSAEVLNERLDAASNINEQNEKDQALATIVLDAATAGEVDIAQRALEKMSDPDTRSRKTQEAAYSLAKRGLRKQAIEMAKGIADQDVRDATLDQLAQ